MLTVACAWWGWYPAEYVTRLKLAVERNLSIPHKFVCMTDFDAPCETVPLDCDLPGNMKLMALYRPNNGLEGRVLAMDLDSLIVGSLDDIASYDGDFCVVRDFNQGTVDGFLRSFEAGKHEYLWEEATDRFSMEIPYFQRHLKEPDYWQDLYPGQVVSYKRHCKMRANDGREKNYPDNARIISFHGRPKMHEAGGWAGQIWSELTS